MKLRQHEIQHSHASEQAKKMFRTWTLAFLTLSAAHFRALRAAAPRVSANLSADEAMNGFLAESEVQESIERCALHFVSGANEEVGEYLYLYDVTWMCWTLSRRRRHLIYAYIILHMSHMSCKT